MQQCVDSLVNTRVIDATRAYFSVILSARMDEEQRQSTFLAVATAHRDARVLLSKLSTLLKLKKVPNYMLFLDLCM